MLAAGEWSPRSADTKTGSIRWPYRPTKPCSLPDADATVKLWSSKDNRLLATLVQLAPGTDKWLIVSAAGYLATSSPGALRWNAEKVSLRPDQLTALLQSSDFVRKAMAGEKVKPPVVK